MFLAAQYYAPDIALLLLGSNVKVRSNLAFCKDIVSVKCNGCFATDLMESKDFPMTLLVLVSVVRPLSIRPD